MLKTMLTNCEKLLKPPIELPQEYCKRCGKPLLYVEAKLGSTTKRFFRPCFCTEDTQASTRGYVKRFSAIGIPQAYIHRRIDYSAYLQALKAHKSLLLYSDDDTSEAIAAKLAMYTSFNTISSKYVTAAQVLLYDGSVVKAQKIPMLALCKLGDEPTSDAALARLYLLLKERISTKGLTVITSRFDKKHLFKYYAFNAEIVKALTTLINDEFTYYDVKDNDEKTKR